MGDGGRSCRASRAAERIEISRSTPKIIDSPMRSSSARFYIPRYVSLQRRPYETKAINIIPSVKLNWIHLKIFTSPGNCLNLLANFCSKNVNVPRYKFDSREVTSTLIIPYRKLMAGARDKERDSSKLILEFCTAQRLSAARILLALITRPLI